MTTQHPLFSLKDTARGFNVFSKPGNSYDRVKHGASAIYILPDDKKDDDPGSYVSAKDTTNTILGKDADKALWYRIRVTGGSIDNITGWIRAVHVESDDDLSGVSVAWTPIRLSLDSNANVRAVRSGPDTDYDTVGSITAGTKYPVLGKDSDLDQDRDAWYEIQYDPTHPDCTGWVPAAQAQIHDAEADIRQDELPVTQENAEGETTGYYKITGLFNDPCRWWERQTGVPLRHEGIDWGCGADKPIRAMAAGEVITAHNDANHGSGKHVIVRTEEADNLEEYVQLRTKDKGRGLAFELSYLHLNSVEVSRKQKVSKGDLLGHSGNTGTYSTGAHLHVHYSPKVYVYDETNDSCPAGPAAVPVATPLPTTAPAPTTLAEPSCSLVEPSPSPYCDREMLLAARDVLRGAHTDKLRTWRRDRPLGAFEGVRVDPSSGWVVALELSYNQLTGFIPPELRQLVYWGNCIWPTTG